MDLKEVDGTPTFKPGDRTGYLLWKDNEGFHLIWTAQRNLHGFRGTITGLKGPVTIKEVVKLESNDLIKQVDPKTITWETRTEQDIDGVIFKADGDFKLELLMDSVKIGVNGIFCGRTFRRPLSNPFIVNLK